MDLLIKINDGSQSGESVMEEVDRLAWMNGLIDNGRLVSCDDVCSSMTREPLE